MRTDLTTAFETAMAESSRAPRQLAIFKFPVTGDLYVSDQVITVGANEYLPLVTEWGALTDNAGGDLTKDISSEIRQMSLTLWNGGDEPFARRFTPLEQPESVVVEVYQWFSSLDEADMALIDKFVIQDPIQYDEVSQLLTLDLVSLTIQSGVIGDIITSDTYPLTPKSSIGKGIDLILGTPGEIECHSVTDVPDLHLNGTILADTLLINVKETISDFSFPATGTLEIESELIIYESYTGSQFVISQRGYSGTEATEHLDDSKLVLFTGTQEFIVGRGPIQSVDNVRVGGFPVPLTIFSADISGAVAKIVFTQKPYSVGFDGASTFLQMLFDNVNAENTAFQAYTVFDPEDNGAARLQQSSETLLSIEQATETVDRGNIVKVFLAIEHWENGDFLNDYAEVSVSGIGVVGILSRPNPDSLTTMAGEVDIDHSHSHSISGEHGHDFVDPLIQAENPLHGHGLTGISSSVVKAPDGVIPTTILMNLTGTGYKYGFKVFTFSGLPSAWTGGYLTVSVTGYNYFWIGVDYTDSGEVWSEVPGDGTTATIGIGSGGTSKTIIIQGRSNVSYGQFVVNALTLTVIQDSTIEDASAGVAISTSVSGSNLNSTDKALDDVDDLATENVEVIDTGTQAATPTTVNLFDVTAEVNFDWSWFDNRTITVEYKGDVDERIFYVRHAFFDVEYRKRQVVFSDDVTCEPVGLIDDGSGTITGTPDALIQRPDHVREYVLTNLSGAQEISIDSTSFSAAGTIYDTLGYEFNGVLSASMTVNAFEKKAAFQTRSRFFWNAGVAKITLKHQIEDQTALKDLGTTDLRLRSMKALKRRSSDIINKIDLLYDKDLLTDTFDAVTSASDNTIPVVMEDRDKWDFDLVSTEAMANDLLDYYINTRATASTFYSFQLYISHLDLEKGDVISLTSNFDSLKKALMEIKSVDRVFGLGRNNMINLLEVTAENLKNIIIRLALSDTVSVVDAISILLAEEFLLSDIQVVVDDLLFSLTVPLSDTVTVDDSFSTVMNSEINEVEAITISENVALNLTLILADSLTISDEISVGDGSGAGFGAAGFGDGGFGGEIPTSDEEGFGGSPFGSSTLFGTA